MNIIYEKNLPIFAPVLIDLSSNTCKYYCSECAQELPSSYSNVCPNCNSKTTLLTGNTAKKRGYLTRITVSEKDDKLFINVFESKTCIHNGKFRFSKYITPYCFNFKTGQAYLLPKLNGKTKKRLQKRDNVIRNISYRPYLINDVFERIGDKIIEEEVISVFKNKARQYLIYDDEKSKLENYRYDRFPADLPTVLINFRYDCLFSYALLSLTKFKYVNDSTNSLYGARQDPFVGDFPSEIRKFFLQKSAKENTEKALTRRLKKTVKFGKETWKILGEDFNTLINGYAIGSLKISNQIKVIEVSKELAKVYESFADTDYSFSWYLSYITQLILTFDNENSATNRLIRISSSPFLDDCHDYSMYQDTAEMLQRIKMSNINIKPFLKSKNIKEMHDKAVTVYNELRNINRKINITASERKLDTIIDNVSLTVCDETDQLMHIGRTMHICVGSYDDLALQKKCLIVRGEKDGKLFACIEIRNNKLYQVKGYCNRLLEKYDQEIIISWAKQKKIEYKNCTDLFVR